MDVQAKLDEMRSVVAEARALPMSASCVVNRGELLAAIDELAEMVPQAFSEANRVLVDRDAVLEEARTQAGECLAAAELERAKLVSESDVFWVSRHEAETLLDEARVETAALRRETDDYVDGRLASFELTLARTLGAVQRGRDRLRAAEAPVAATGPRS